MKSHKDLDVWKKSIDLVSEIYKLTSLLPENEKFGLVNQMRRCSVSIPSNIAEGAGRQNEKEFRRFLYMALGSLSELETQLIISENLNFISKPEDIIKEMNEIRKMTIGLIRNLEKKILDKSSI
jgi:four helix bundle protein